jgi:flavin reductase (DIM6/NTAB) family NADH-FMN oxidoreductase RutF
MVLIQIDVITMRRDVLTVPPPPSSSSERKIVALVDAHKLQPIASMGYGRYATMAGLNLLLRPSKTENGGWISDEFEVKPATTTNTGDGTTPLEDDMPVDASGTILEERIEWITSQPSPLGFDPIKAIVVPRPIGWISTYYESPTDNVLVPHIAPYSFYMDVARGLAPMVALSAYRPTDGPLKDVQLDIQDSQCFGVSNVTPELVIAMNLSSAPIERDDSEFELAGLRAMPAEYVKAPLIDGTSSNNGDDDDGSPLVLECKYVKTVDVGGFSVLIGNVVSIKVSETVLTDGHVDGTKLKAVTRLGYNDEYAVVDQPVDIAHA